MSFYEQSKDNELWMDAEGAIYTRHPYTVGWLTFGVEDTIQEDNDLLFLPMVRFMQADGTIDPEWVNPRIAWLEWERKMNNAIAPD